MPAPYAPTREHTILATDSALAIEWPAGHDLSLSDRDAAGPTLAGAEAAGTLPTWKATKAFAEELRKQVH